MKIPLWAIAAGAAVVGYFVIRPMIGQWCQANPENSLCSTLANTGIFMTPSFLDPATYSSLLGPGANAPAAQVTAQSNRVSYYNPANYSSNVAYGYGPMSASGTYNSLPSIA